MFYYKYILHFKNLFQKFEILDINKDVKFSNFKLSHRNALFCSYSIHTYLDLNQLIDNS